MADQPTIVSIDGSGTTKFPNVVREYQLPKAEQTHELVIVDDTTILITQQSNSHLLKVKLDPGNGLPVSVRSFLVGKPTNGLHGLGLSKTHKGKVWATLQSDNSLILIDPKAGEPDAPPVIEQYIPVPAPGTGPHCVIEYGDDLWASLKGASRKGGEYFVLRINHENHDDYTLYPVAKSPVFIASHSRSGDIYASVDSSSQIIRIAAGGRQLTQGRADGRN